MAFAPIIAAGILLPGLQSEPPPVAGAQVGMTDEGYEPMAMTIHVGDHLTLVNNSDDLHVLVQGSDGKIITQPGAPSLDGEYGTHVSESGDIYTTQIWEMPGTYHLTCTLHPEMNVDVIVLPD